MTQLALLRPHNACIAVVGLLLCFLSALPSVAADYLESEIAGHEKAAAAYRAEAEKASKFAQQYRELAVQAEHEANKATDADIIEDWRRQAQARRRHAEEQEANAARNLKWAEEEEKQAKEERRALALKQAKSSKLTPDPAPNPDTTSENRIGLSLRQVLGVWRYGYGLPFVILQEDPGFKAYPYRLEGHTLFRVWHGRYNPAPKDGEPRMTFEYVPTAEEMNSEIPHQYSSNGELLVAPWPWDRQAVDGQVVYRMEVFEKGTIGSPHLYMTVRHGEARRRTDVAPDEGDRKELTLIRDNDIRLATVLTPTIIVRPSFVRESNPPPVHGMIKGQLFFIEVVLPPELVEQRGDSITVSVSSEGQSVPVKLKAGGSPRGSSIVYTHSEPIAIEDSAYNTAESGEYAPPVLSIPWLLGEKGTRLGLDLSEKAAVTISYDENEYRFNIYQDVYLQGLDYYKDLLEKVRLYFNGILYDKRFTRDTKEAATDRLQMLKNLSILLASDKIGDRRKYAVARFYLQDEGLFNGLALSTDEEIEKRVLLKSSSDLNVNAPLTDAERDGANHPSGYFRGVVWTSRLEMVRVHEILVAELKKIKEENFFTLVKGFTFLGYDYVASASIAGSLTTIIFGHDHYGNKLVGWERVNAAVGLASDLTLQMTLPRVAKKYGIGEKPKVRSRHGTPRKRVGNYTRGFEPDTDGRGGIHMPPGLPETVTKARWKAQFPETSPKAAGSVEWAPPRSGPRVGLPGPPAPLPTVKTDPALIDLLRRSPHPAKMVGADMQAMTEEYGRNARMISHGVAPRQIGGTCNCEAFLHIVERATGVRVPPMRALRQMVDLGILEEPIRGNGQHVVTFGFHDEEVSGLASQAYGARVRESTPDQNPYLFLRDFDQFMQNGWYVKNVLKFDRGLHAVAVEEFIKNSDGDITHVRFFDPAYGFVVELPAADYDALLLKSDEWANFQMFKFK